MTGETKIARDLVGFFPQSQRNRHLGTQEACGPWQHNLPEHGILFVFVTDRLTVEMSPAMARRGGSVPLLQQLRAAP